MSGTPPTRVATQAAPAAIASSNTSGEPSPREGSTKIPWRSYCARISVSLSMRSITVTDSRSWGSNHASTSSRGAPVPTSVSRAAGCPSRTRRHMPGSRRRPLRSIQVPTNSTPSNERCSEAAASGTSTPFTMRVDREGATVSSRARYSRSIVERQITWSPRRSVPLVCQKRDSGALSLDHQGTSASPARA